MKIKLFGAATASLLALAAAGAHAQSINVQVNGNPVSFDGPGPIERNDSVLVPLRGVFEAMGASVDWDASTHMVRAYRGGQSVLLPIGSTQATVGGRTVQLSQPAMIVGGATMVPLRFVAESLGATVDWVAANNLVAIHTGGVYAETPPVPAPETRTNITTITGRVASTRRLDDGRRIIRLDDGQAFTLSDDARITMNGRSVGIDDIQPYDRISLRVDTDTNRAFRVTVNPRSGPGPERAPETLRAGMAPVILAPANGATVGDRVAISGRAYPGATIRLRVEYSGRSNGGGYTINGTQMSRDVVADDSGRWATTLRLNANANDLDDDTVHYTIEARTVGPDGDLSPMESISVGGGRVYAHRRLQ